jgi:class 3 adenylate cyclase/tetratricopeptide (TPR) repeat protein
MECGHPTGVSPTPVGGDWTAPQAPSIRPREERPPAPQPRPYPALSTERPFRPRPEIEEERKLLTVLFSDVVGSTELVQELDPEEAKDLLEPAVRAMIEAVHRFEGTVCRVMGDGIMALFGAPIAHEDHALQACLAGLAMQEGVQRYCEQVRARRGIAVAIRVGLHTGEVVVGALTNDLHAEYSAIGATSHLAARMEQLAIPGTIQLTLETLHLVEGLVQVRSLGPVAVKGMARPVEIFELLGVGSVRSRLEARLSRGLTPFVGRQDELQTLERGLGQGSQGHGQVVALVGEPGCGKSRLLWELTHSARAAEWLTLQGDSAAYGRASPYLPFIDLLARYFQVAAGDAPEVAKEKVTAHVLAIDESLRVILPAVYALFDLPHDDREWAALDPPRRRRRTQEAIKGLLLRESELRPVLLLIENLHWADTESLALLDILVASIPTARMVLVVTYRPEYQHEWGGRSCYQQIRIDPLAPDSAADLVRALVGDGREARLLVDHLIEQTDGNPFFLEECIRSLVETGALVGERGAYQVTRPIKSIHVPASVKAVLAARIDRLPPGDKRLLQAASIIGKKFSLPVLRAIADAGDDELDESMGHLRAAELLYETRLYPETEYTFKHALTLDVAYEGVLLQRRRALHARIVGAIEQLYPDRLIEQADRLAQHALAGQQWEQAADYSRQAAGRAVATGAYRAAVANLERALDALAEVPRTPAALREAVDIHLELRSSLQPLGEIPAILDHLHAAEALAEELDDPARLARTFSYLCSYFVMTREPDRSVPHGERAVELARQLDNLSLQVPASFFLGEALYSLGEFDHAVTMLLQTSAGIQGDRRFDRFGMTGLPAVLSRGIVGRSLAELGQFDEGARYSLEAIRIAEEADHAYSLASACSTDGFVHLLRADPARAIMSLTRSIELCRSWSFRPHLASALARLGYAHLLADRIDEALPLLEQAVRQAREIGGLNEQVFLEIWLSEAYARVDRLDEALDAARVASDLVDQSRQRGKRPYVLRQLGRLAAARGGEDLAEAELLYREAVAVARNLRMRPLEAHLHGHLADLYRATGQAEAAAVERAADDALSRSLAFAPSARPAAL